MSFDHQQLLEDIRNLSPDYGDPDIHSLLEFLGINYLLCNPVNPEELSQVISSLESVFSRLSHRNARLIRHTLSEIASIYTRKAFQHGILVGAHLILELSEPHSADSTPSSAPAPPISG